MARKRDFIPSSEASVVSFTENFAQLIDEMSAELKLSRALIDDYARAQAEFARRLTDSRNPDTRGLRTVFLKNESKRTLLTLTRQIARQLNGQMDVSDDQRLVLGLSIRRRGTRSQPPGEPPQVRLTLDNGRTVRVNLSSNTTRRGRDPAARSAMIYTHIGDTPPTSPDQWRAAVLTTRTRTELWLGPSTVGDTLWVSACWLNALQEAGPMSDAIRINLPAGGSLPGRALSQPAARAA